MTHELLARQIWEDMLAHQQAVTRASHYWANTDHKETWRLLNEASNNMVKEMSQFAERQL